MSDEFEYPDDAGHRKLVGSYFVNQYPSSESAPRQVVPSVEATRFGIDNWMLERAEEACTAGLPLEQALQAVRDGYSSIEADRMIAAEDAEDDELV